MDGDGTATGDRTAGRGGRSEPGGRRTREGRGEGEERSQPDDGGRRGGPGGSTAGPDRELAEVGNALDGGAPGARGGPRARLADQARWLLAPRALLAALSVAAGGLLAAETTISLPGAGLVGVFLATFVLGAVLGGRHYVEATLAGAVVVCASVLLAVVVVPALGLTRLQLAGLGAVVGGWVGLAGSYLGRRLRRLVASP